MIAIDDTLFVSINFCNCIWFVFCCFLLSHNLLNYKSRDIELQWHFLLVLVHLHIIVIFVHKTIKELQIKTYHGNIGVTFGIGRASDPPFTFLAVRAPLWNFKFLQWVKLKSVEKTILWLFYLCNKNYRKIFKNFNVIEYI